MNNKYLVNKTLKISIIDSERVQFRYPDYNNFTIEFNSNILQSIIMTEGTMSYEDWVTKITECGVGSEDAVDILNDLLSCGVICPERMIINNMFDSLLANEDFRTLELKKEVLDNIMIKKVGIFGSGELAEIVKDSVNKVTNMEISKDNPDMIFVCCDYDDISSLKSLWKNSPDSLLKLAFWFDGGALRLGPFFILNESACFSCFADRINSASQFIDEAEVYESQLPISVSNLPLGITIENLASYIVLRTLNLAKTRQFNILEPSNVESWAILTGEYSKKFVVRNPFCSTCTDVERPKRAIRDMA
ncbi:TPA: hypothetical protein ACMDNS_002803 [Vibrio cholerae]|uniref:Bacteriocin biosynthesis cyclodehydratase domain-containing protein n=1 Tax=Vibrio paracholerae TaxID=650003 RepID=A0ABD7FQP5_9VIBR|nr:hypothetical protein [Vibrio paracholerae]RBM59502.1 hypothetical protein DLR72_18280 [Vibrio paracholerae]